MEINISRQTDFLEVVVSGQFNNDEAGGQFSMIIATCVQFRLSRCLVDFSGMTGQLHAVQRIFIGHSGIESFQKQSTILNLPFKIAFIGREQYVSDYTPAADLMRQIGWDVLVTADHEKAYNWIKTSDH